MSALPDPELVTDEINAAGLDALMNEPLLADLREKLTERDCRRIVSVVTAATSTTVATLMLNWIAEQK